MATLLIATRNAHKLREIGAILGTEFYYLDLNHFPGAPIVVEDAGTFAGNATKKAVQAAEWLCADSSSELRSPGAERFVLADDSGLEVDALGGAPGVHSARFAGLEGSGGRSDQTNNEKLLRLMEHVPDEKRTARFRCVIALTPWMQSRSQNRSSVCFANELELQTELFEGTCEGRIGGSPCGQGGFGYDPLFIPSGFEIPFAELEEALKNQLSHRAQALAKVRRRLLRSSM
jgi:XTP/dITP diphosphohydrolase